MKLPGGGEVHFKSGTVKPLKGMATLKIGGLVKKASELLMASPAEIARAKRLVTSDQTKPLLKVGMGVLLGTQTAKHRKQLAGLQAKLVATAMSAIFKTGAKRQRPVKLLESREHIFERESSPIGKSRGSDAISRDCNLGKLMEKVESAVKGQVQEAGSKTLTVSVDGHSFTVHRYDNEEGDSKAYVTLKDLGEGAQKAVKLSVELNLGGGGSNEAFQAVAFAIPATRGEAKAQDPVAAKSKPPKTIKKKVAELGRKLKVGPDPRSTKTVKKNSDDLIRQLNANFEPSSHDAAPIHSFIDTLDPQEYERVSDGVRGYLLNADDSTPKLTATETLGVLKEIVGKADSLRREHDVASTLSKGAAQHLTKGEEPALLTSHLVTGNGQQGLITPLCKGDYGDLNKAVAGDPGFSTKFPLEERLKNAESLMATLAAIHQKGWSHNDIKPDNIFVRADGVAVLADYGLTRKLSDNTPTVVTDREGKAVVAPAAKRKTRLRKDWDGLANSIITGFTPEEIGSKKKPGPAFQSLKQIMIEHKIELTIEERTEKQGAFRNGQYVQLATNISRNWEHPKEGQLQEPT